MTNPNPTNFLTNENNTISTNIDINSLFLDVIYGNTAPINTGFDVSGADLITFFAYGQTTLGSVPQTNYVSGPNGGVDINSIFMPAPFITSNDFNISFNSGTFTLTFTTTSAPINITFLQPINSATLTLVGGGGGSGAGNSTFWLGAAYIGGGGGGGGEVINITQNLMQGLYTINVGGGGSAGYETRNGNTYNGQQGGTSSISSITSIAYGGYGGKSVGGGESVPSGGAEYESGGTGGYGYSGSPNPYVEATNGAPSILVGITSYGGGGGGGPGYEGATPGQPVNNNGSLPYGLGASGGLGAYSEEPFGYNGTNGIVIINFLWT